MKEFISSWIRKLTSEKIKIFPDDFLNTNLTETVNFPSQRLIIGKQFFGEYELITAEGMEFIRTENLEKAKYFLYANRTLPKKILIPIELKDIQEMIISYEKYIDSMIIRRIDDDFKRCFPKSKNSAEIINKIMNHINLIRL